MKKLTRYAVTLLVMCVLFVGVAKAVEITFTLSSDDAVRLVDAFCERGGYEENKLEAETRAEFARRMHRALLQRIVKSIEDRAAKEAAAESVETITVN